MTEREPRMHFYDPYEQGTACGLSLVGRKITRDLVDVTCKVCLKVTTQGHR